MPGIQQTNFSPVPPASNLRILFGDGVNRSPEEIQSLLAPTPEGLDGEWDEPPSWQGPSWIPPMFVCGGLCSGSAVLVGSLMQVGAALRVGNDHVPVDQGIRRRALEAVVQPRLLNLELPPRVGPGPGPSGAGGAAFVSAGVSATTGGGLILATADGAATTSGSLRIRSANAGTTGVSGLLVFSSGTSSSGTSGSVSIGSGAATGGAGGAMSITVGSGNSGAGGDLLVFAGMQTLSLIHI